MRGTVSFRAAPRGRAGPLPEEIRQVSLAGSLGTGWHGRALPCGGRRPGPGAPHGHQDRAAAPGGCRVRGAVPRRGEGRREAQPRQPHPRVRRRARQRRAVHRDGLRRGPRPPRGVEPLRQEAGRVPDRCRRLHREGAVSRPLLRAQLPRAEPRAPRRVAPERPRLVHGRGQADRLRARLVDAQARADGARHHLRQGRVHVAGAGARREARWSQRHVRDGDRALGAAHGAPAVPAGQGSAAGSDRAREEPRADAPEQASPPRAGRARRDLSACAGSRARRSLRGLRRDAHGAAVVARAERPDDRRDADVRVPRGAVLRGHRARADRAPGADLARAHAGADAAAHRRAAAVGRAERRDGDVRRRPRRRPYRGFTGLRATGAQARLRGPPRARPRE